MPHRHALALPALVAALLSATPIDAHAAPDLTVESITLTPATPAPGAGSLKVTFKNIGTSDVDLAWNEYTNYAAYRDGEPCDDGFIADLSDGDTNQEDISACVPSASGSYLIEVVIDSDHDVSESDETNNTLQRVLFWGDPCDHPERCDGLDNDCDGETDEGFSVGTPCVTPGAGCPSVWTCTSGGDSAECLPDLAAPERCNGLDDDCDGSTDEDFSNLGASCTAGVGDCSGPGVFACTADQGGTVCVRVGPDVEERCDGLDNDCDGETDEPFVLLGTPCQRGRGACETWGVFVCAAEAESGALTCDAQPPEGSAERCDNRVDDDCDGATDEGCPCERGEEIPCGSAAGECEPGAQPCLEEGVFAERCQGAVEPSEERCGDERDDDCDGSVDEGCPCAPPGAVRACGPDAGTCSAAGRQVCGEVGLWEPCTGATVYAPETCDDGVDQDCDGRTDENCAVDLSCHPECVGRLCGADGCGGFCGRCDLGEHCSVAGLCEPNTTDDDAPLADASASDVEAPAPSASADGGCGGGAPPSGLPLAALLTTLLAVVTRRRRRLGADPN